MLKKTLTKTPSRFTILALLASLILAGMAAWQVSGKTQTAIITFVCCDYSPGTVTIRTGEEVLWQGDFNSHPLVSQDGFWPTVGSGTEFSHTFTQPGEYWYYCEIHGGQNGQGMSGKVIVVDNKLVFLPLLNR
jgi:plastocyanin